MRPAPYPGHRQRQLRLLVLDALDQRVKQFHRREELWPLRIPNEPLLLTDIIEQTIGDDSRSFDPSSLRSRPLLHLGWDDGSAWDAWVVQLPSGLKLYCDSSEEEDRVLASGGRNEGDESDRTFLQLLAESAGAHFGIEMSGGAPSRVRSSIADRPFLVEVFLNLLEVTGTEDSVRRQLEGPGESEPAAPTGRDFQAEVQRWLDLVTTTP